MLWQVEWLDTKFRRSGRAHPGEAADAVVDGDDDLRTDLGRALDDGRRQAVAVGEAVRHQEVEPLGTHLLLEEHCVPSEATAVVRELLPALTTLPEARVGGVGAKDEEE